MMSCDDATALAEIDRLVNWHMSEAIPLDAIRCWMQSDNIEVLGGVASIVGPAPNWERIEPSMQVDELESFIFRYYERCLVEDPESDWAESRYGAAREIVEWYRVVPLDEDVNTQIFLIHMKDWLRKVYMTGTTDIR